MKNSIVLALLVSLASAKPMAHQHFHKKDLELLRRDEIISTVIEETTTTVDVFVTVYGPAPDTQVNIQAAANNQPAANPDPKPTGGANPQKSGNDQHHDVETQQKNAQAYNGGDNQQNQGQQSPEEHQKHQEELQEGQKQKQKEQERLQQEQIDKQAGYQQQQQQPQQQQPAPQQQQQQPAQQQQEQQQPAQQQQQQQPAQQQQQQAPKQGGGGGAGGGGCGEVGGKCQASDVTIYNDQGIGSCGWTNDTTSEDFFALAANTFGGYTNDAPGPHKNAFCGRMATISYNGKEVEGMVTDKCPGCNGWSIDLSQSLWNKVTGGLAPTRLHDIEWWFTGEEVYHGAGG